MLSNRVIKNASLSTSLRRKMSLFFGSKVKQLLYMETFQDSLGQDEGSLLSFFVTNVLGVGL